MTSPACPYCAEEIPAGSRRCGSCGKELVKTCDFCLEEIPALARTCRYCRSDLRSPTGGDPREPGPEERRRAATLGEERGVLVTVLLGFMTFGIHTLVTLHHQMREIAAHQGKGRGLDPNRDILLATLSWVFTLGLAPVGVYYVLYKYPKALQETCLDEEVPCRDVLTPALLLALSGLSLPCIGTFLPLWSVSAALVQNELNQHWIAHRALRA